MRFMINGVATLTIVLTGLLHSGPSTAAPRITQTVTSDAFSSQSADARQVLDWVTRHVQPTFAPQGYGTVQVEHSAAYAGSSTRLSNASPPGKLPDQGVPGEVYRVENILPDGSLQSWEFVWSAPSSGHGGGWGLTGYTYKKGNDPIDPP